MKRLVLVLALILALDAAGTFSAAPQCDSGPSPISCLAGIDQARSALPSGHADVVGITFVVPRCEGYCPLVRYPGVTVVFYLADHTRDVVSVWLIDQRLSASYQGSDSWG